jgi:hypothetical protein
MLLILLVVYGCKVNDASSENKNEESTAEQIEDIKTFEFTYNDIHFNGGIGTGVDDLNTIDDFDEYFQIENNIVIQKDASTPFTGKIILYTYFFSYETYEYITTKFNNVRELNFLNGCLSRLEYTGYHRDGTISDQGKYNVFSFFDNEKQMKYYFHLLEYYSYFNTSLPDGTPVNNLTDSRIAENEIPGGLYKYTRHYTTGEIYEEGYGQIVTVPQYYEAEEHYGHEEQISWGWESSKVGIWKHYFNNGENYNETMWGLINQPVDDIKTYSFDR